MFSNSPALQNTNPDCANSHFQQPRTPFSTVGFNRGSASLFGFDCSFALPPELVKSKFSSRSKPRLVKHRKKSAPENSNRVDDDGTTSNNTTSGSSSSASGLRCGNHANFVYGVNNSVFGFNSNSDKRESNGNVGYSGAGEFGNLDFNFLFGTNKSSWTQHSESRRGQCGESEGPVQLGKSNNEGFAFGDNKSYLPSNFQQTESSYSGGSVERAGGIQCKPNSKYFKFGGNVSHSASNLNSKCRESSEGLGQFGTDEFRKFDSKTFVFGQSNSGLASQSNLEKQNLYASVQGSGSSGFEKVDSQGFIFRANKGDSLSNSIKGKLDVDVNSVFGSNVSNLNSALKKSVSVGNHGYPLSNSNLEKNGFDENFGKSDPEPAKMKFDCDDRSKINVDTEKDTKKANDNGVFIFESGCKGSFNGRNKLNNGTPGSYNGLTGSKNDYVGSDFRDTFDLVFESNSNVAGSLHNLSDDMNALNINDFEKINIANKTECSNCSSFVNVKNAFVFGSCNKSSSSVIRSVNGGVIHEDGRVNVSACTEKSFAYASKEETAGSSERTIKDKMPDEIRNTSTSSKTESYYEKSNYRSYVEFEKRNQPANLNEKSSDGGNLPRDQPNNDSDLKKAFFSSTFSAVGLRIQPTNGVSEAPYMGRLEKEEDLSFKSMQFGQQASFKDFELNVNRFSSLKVNPFHMSDKKFEFSSSNRSTRDRRLKKKFGKLRQQALLLQFNDGHLSKDGNFQLNKESNVCGSPMDFSPCQDKSCIPSIADSAVSDETIQDNLTTLREGSDISEGKDSGGTHDKDSRNCSGSYSVSGCQLVESASGPGIECVNSKAEQISAHFPSGISSHADSEEKDHMMQTSASSTSDKFPDGNVTFTFSTPEQDSLLAIRRQYRKKYRLKVGRGSDHTASSKIGTSSADELAKRRPSEGTAWEICEKWRIRGNQAYKNGNLSQAEDLFTKGINSIPHTETVGCCIETLALCYSNRAAARMSLGRMREALDDCTRAESINPSFLKVQIRAANCHLVLGELEYALQYFNKCLESGNAVCLDRRITIEAADGLQKAQKVVDCRNQSTELILKGTYDAASTALGLIDEALSISYYSEKLFELKGEALCLLQKYEEAIQLCEQTISFAEKNFAFIDNHNHFENVNDSEHKNSSIKIWRWCLMSKAYYYSGKLEMALDVIEKQEDLRSMENNYKSLTQESSFFLASTVRELLQHKKEGNEAFQSGRHTEAIEHYGIAISSGIESRPFAAICFCNRAAAHQALGEIADAIADCSIAIALDESYSKALSRRATLHETIRDYEQAANDLRRFISLLESQSQKKAQPWETSERLTGSSLKDLNRARRRLSSVEDKATRGIPLDLYKILGIKSSDTLAEIKKAYRKAALKHHPDKVGQFLARSDSGDNGKLWKEIVEEVHKDADRLFKMIGEAYTILSDPDKRSDYDLEEEMRNNQKNSYRSCGSRKDVYYNSPFGRRRSSGR